MEYDIAKEYCKIIQDKINVKDFDGALTNAKKLVAYEPTYAEGYYYLGLCYFALSNYPDSIENYKKSIELNKDFPKTYFNLGITQYYTGKFKEAVLNINTAYGMFKRAKNEEACTKCLEASDFIKEEQGL